MIAFALGGNKEDSLKWITNASKELGNCLLAPKFSKIYQTKPLGPGSRPFFNMAMTGFSEIHSLDFFWGLCEQLEDQSGRDRESEIPWGDRVLDVDILFHKESVVVREDLIVPHPQLHRRPFVLVPLMEIAPQWRHPILGQTIEELWGEMSENVSSEAPGAVFESFTDLLSDLKAS